MSNETAFPNEGFNWWGEPQQGMTLRDYFAAKAMQAILMSETWLEEIRKEYCMTDQSKGETIAISAYQMADAMMTVRETK